MKKHDYDLIILGSGAGGSVGAHHARSLGKKVAIIERAEIGGECPNWACVPTKALLHAADVYETVQNAHQYGIEVKGVTVNYPNVRKWRDLVVSRTGTAHGEQSFRKDGIHLIRGRGSFVSPNELEVDGKTISAKKILIATGSQVFIPPIPGLAEAGFITFKEAAEFKQVPSSIFILGGGPIGCEFAQIYSSFGVKVTIGDTLPQLLAHDDLEVSNIVRGLFENRGINVLTGIQVLKVEEKQGKKVIHYQHGSKTDTIEVVEILVATGKRPVLDFAPEKAGIKINHGFVKVNRFLQTNVPHIYAAGDIVGPYLFTHTGYYQSYIAVVNAFSHLKVHADYVVVPRCTFLKPEVASVGLSEVMAKEQHIRIKKALVPMAILGRSNTTNDFDGFVKIITDSKSVIIGASIVAPRAGEMIHELALAIKLKVNASVVAEMLHAYPTFSEGVKIACSSLE